MHKVRISNIYYILRYLGFKWFVFRILYTLKIQLGLIRYQTPITAWAEINFHKYFINEVLSAPEAYFQYRKKDAPVFFFSTQNRKNYQAIFAKWDQPINLSIKIANDLIKGNIQYFSNEVKSLGFPFDWFHDPFLNRNIISDNHWSQIPDFGEHDIKVIWEPSRFSFVYALVRAYWRTNDESYAECFWRLVEDWQDKNPPHRGPNWKCGQEITFRLMAWIFGLYGFFESPATNAQRVLKLAKMIAVSGERIQANIKYALSQKNNHGISEAVGLWTIGILFPEFKQSKQWLGLGRQILENEAGKLIYDDGAFAQHSLNYHRLMLHDYLWALRLGEINDNPLSGELKKRVEKAGEFLFKLIEQASGKAPNYGPNDGALVLPLNNCDYYDYRSVVQSVYYLVNKKKCYKPGPWDEDLLWLFGNEAVAAVTDQPNLDNLQADIGGYYTLRSQDGFIFVRCANFKHRPNSADMLHVDLWWRGQNIAIDPGTFSYNARPPFENDFTGTAYHNTVSVNAKDQMNRVSKFLWLPWLKSAYLGTIQSDAGLLDYWQGKHFGYNRLKSGVMHQRGILRIANLGWLVLDSLKSTIDRNYCLHWLFPDICENWDAEGNLVLRTPSGKYFVQIKSLQNNTTYSFFHGDEKSAKGWFAPYYYSKRTAISVEAHVRSKEVLFITLFSPKETACQITDSSIKIENHDWQLKMTLNLNKTMKQLVNSVLIEGSYKDNIIINF